MNRIITITKNNKYGLIVLFLLVFFLLSNFDSSIDEDALCSYIIDYHTGFGGRKFIASILSLIFGITSLNKIELFVYCISIFICALLAYLVNKYIKNMKEYGIKSYFSSLYILTLYLLCPASIMFLLKYPNLGRLDIYLYGACLLLIILFNKRKNNRLFYFLSVLLLLIICILTHHIFVSTYMVFFVALFIYDIWEDCFNKKIFYCYFVLGIISLSVLLAVLFFSSMNISLDQALHYNPNFILSRKFVCFGYYAHLVDHIEQYTLPKLPRLLVGFLLTNLFLLPLTMPIWKIWKALYTTLDRKTKKLLCSMFCANLLFIPAFLITVDYPRWFGAFFSIQLLLILFFSLDKSTKFHDIYKIIIYYLENHLFYALSLLIYCSILGYFYSDTYFSIIELILDKMNIARVTTLLPIEYRL